MRQFMFKFDVNAFTMDILYEAECSCRTPLPLYASNPNKGIIVPIPLYQLHHTIPDCNLILNGEYVQNALDALHEKLCAPHKWNSRQITAMQLTLLWLSRATGMLPNQLLVRNGVENIQPVPVAGGSFADVHLAKYQGESVALKRVRIFQTFSEQQKTRRCRSLYREAMIWRQLDHPHILPLYGIDLWSFEPAPCLVLPWIEYGNIHKTIASFGTESMMIYFMPWIFEVAVGMDYLHSQGIVHGDLRGPNILIDNEFHVRLSDFGLASVTEDGNMSTLSSHTWNARWAAPELLEPEDEVTFRWPDYCSDIFSFGCLCIEIFTQDAPYQHISSDVRVVTAVLRGDRPRRPENGAMPLELWNLAQKCWVHNPHDRPRIGFVIEELERILSKEWEVAWRYTAQSFLKCKTY
ncbi:hypothetical protein QCA50_017375 [Cerrena zonata]|uniref:Protein kinase domain-containing protein n=1 Tax=Cerrena zonata TaxID=2478898 RepID=A0AAW0FFF5_9APHY